MSASVASLASAPAPKRILATTRRSRARVKPSKPGAVLGRDLGVRVGRAVVANPYNANERIDVEVNHHVDILSEELARGRITEAQFLVGRSCQKAWERASGSMIGGASWGGGSSRDQTEAHERRICAHVVDAKEVAAFNDRVAAAVGWTGMKILRRFLVEGFTFKAYAGLGASERQVGKVADRFRHILENLTEALHTATGADGQRIRATRTIETA